MLQISLTDPADHPPKVLIALAAFLTACAGAAEEIEEVYKGLPPLNVVRTVRTVDPESLDASYRIAPNDRPDSGAPTEDDVAASQALAAFGGNTGALPVPNVGPVVSAPVAALVPALLTALAPPRVELDASGLPWDARIHSSNHEKNKGDNLWRARRNVDPVLVAAVEIELRKVMSLPAPNAVAAIPTPPALISVPSIPAPSVTSVTSASPSSGVTTFAELAGLIMPAVTSGQITQAQILAACQSVGLPNFPSLSQREDFVPAVYAKLFP